MKDFGDKQKKRNRAQTKTPSSPNPRLLAAKCLIEQQKTGKFSLPDRTVFPLSRDYALFHYLIQTAIRHQRRLLHLIEILTGKNCNKLKPEVIAVIMLGLVQLDHTSHTPEHAAIFETVELISRLNRPFFKNFVNAALRKYQRDKDKVNGQIEKESSLALRTSHPDWMVQRWIDQYGIVATEQICRANNIPSAVNLVLNPSFDFERVVQELSEQGYQPGIRKKKPASIRVEESEGIFGSGLFRQGAFIVQDPASQNIVPLMKNWGKKTVFDACSAPGGKLIHLEWAYGNEIDLLVAGEIASTRLPQLRDNLARVGSKAKIVVCDAGTPPLKKQFDLVLADVPCSATGNIRKHPEIKWKRMETDFITNREKQLRILQGLANVVAPNGRIVYMTCSLEEEENQGTVNKFLEDSKGNFVLEAFPFEKTSESCLTQDGFYQCLPDINNTGLFAAVFRKTETRDSM